MSVVVVGGGWAGLAAATKLASHHIPVTLLEAAKQLGGRARCVPFNDLSVDNGQHLMIGAYREMLKLLDRVGVDESDAFVRRPLDLAIHSPRAKPLRVATRNLPAPLNLLFGLATTDGLSLAEKASALRFCVKLAAARFRVKEDISVQALLIRHRQSGRLLHHLWAPLCIATLNTLPHEASARVFLRVLRDSFAFRRDDSDLLIPRYDLSRIVPEPAMDYIEKNNGTVRLRHRIKGLRIQNGRILGVSLDEEEHGTSHVILATPPHVAQRLLAPHGALDATAASLARLEHEPICTVYLRYADDVRLGVEMVGLVDTTAQWVFDRTTAGQPGLMAVVISAHGVHCDWDNETLSRKVASELAQAFPHLPEPKDYMVIHEKRATFSCRVNVEELRPENKTPIDGLWLAGDYTDTGYPATLEGAIISGQRAAEGVLATYR